MNENNDLQFEIEKLARAIEIKTNQKTKLHGHLNYLRAKKERLEKKLQFSKIAK